MTFCIAFLLVQTAVPVTRLLADVRPGRWGWHMYAGYGTNAVRYELVLADGEVRPVVGQDHVVIARGDLPMERYVPGHLCRTTTARAIRLKIGDGPWTVQRCP